LRGSTCCWSTLPRDSPGEDSMATAEMIQELIRAHVTGDAARFRQIAMQVASREARSGHRLAAGKIRDLLDEVPIANEPPPTPIVRPPRDLQGILAVSYPDASLGDIVLEGDAENAFGRVLAEQFQAGKLREWGLNPRRRLLLHGPPGCGKTLSASVLAGELSLPLFRVRVESLFSRYMGDTAGLLTEIFSQAAQKRGVYLFDEFDAIGKHRADENDVGEARRIVSTFLQLIDADESESVLIAATNERGAIDAALFRRFDDVVPFQLPERRGLEAVLRLRTASYGFDRDSISILASSANGLSFADVTAGVTNAVKTMVLEDREILRADDVSAALLEIAERQAASP
jgi:SpoVK/Ycf46/Vps4 family AAA+-type ATPase